jgi:hypothetical protein
VSAPPRTATAISSRRNGASRAFLWMFIRSDPGKLRCGNSRLLNPLRMDNAVSLRKTLKATSFHHRLSRMMKLLKGHGRYGSEGCRRRDRRWRDLRNYQ